MPDLVWILKRWLSPGQHRRTRHLVFLKLGGSLITEKTKPYTARLEQIDALARVLAQILTTMPDLALLIGHGSGSFGHQAAQEEGTRAGLSANASAETQERYWRGFVEVAYQAARLHRLVIDALHRAGVPAISFPPSAILHRTRSGKLQCSIAPVHLALEAGLVPVVYGDVLFDARQGGGIVSTEEVFEALALPLRPQRILLAGLEDGVWADFPHRTRLISEIDAKGFEQLRSSLGGAEGIDVTGGMLAKVEGMLRLACRLPGMRIFIFSAADPKRLEAAFRDQAPGTWITC
ncbi:MAG: isopentenyl phosphate kinase [Anaerolineales bacterium]